jgi:hypothetical protein
MIQAGHYHDMPCPISDPPRSLKTRCTAVLLGLAPSRLFFNFFRVMIYAFLCSRC